MIIHRSTKDTWLRSFLESADTPPPPFAMALLVTSSPRPLLKWEAPLAGSSAASFQNPPGTQGKPSLARASARNSASGGASSRSPAGGRRAKDLGAAARVWLCCLSGSQPAKEIKEDQIKRPESSVTLADLVQASPRSAPARTGLLHC